MVVFDWDDYESFDLISLFEIQEVEIQEENAVIVSDPWREGMFSPIPFIDLSGIFQAGPSEPAEKEQRLYKTERCRFFLQGICTRGAKCKYAHGRDLRPKEVHALYKTRFCHYFLDGKECPYGVKNRCSFKHEIFNPEEFEEFKKAVERRMKASQHKPQE